MVALGYGLEKQNYLRRFNADTTLWVAIQVTEPSPSELGVFPRVGFFNRQVTDLLGKALAIGPPVPPTLSWTLGYLMPQPLRTEWVFAPEPARISENIESVVAGISVHGTPAMTRYPSVVSLLTWAEDPLRDRHGIFFQRDLLRAIVYYLNRQGQSALTCIEATFTAAAPGETNDPAFAPYRRLKRLLE
jgi:hypothetical protein